MKIGFFVGSTARIGAAQTLVLPLAKALSSQGEQAYGLETSRFMRTRRQLQGITIEIAPVIPTAIKLLGSEPDTFHRRTGQREPAGTRLDARYRMMEGATICQLACHLDLDLLLISHNFNVAAVLPYWPRRRPLLAMNLIGFGIDPSRGGRIDTFPFQHMIFMHPYWNLHFASTLFEYEQYHKVYAKLGIDDSRLHYLPHAYDDTIFQPASRHQLDSQSRSSDELRLVYPVNVYPRKNIELAIEVVAQLNTLVRSTLTITGAIWDRAYHHSLLDLAKRYKVQDNIVFAGGLSYSELAKRIQCSDVAIFTSHQETFGLGIAESLGCGVPVVGPGWIKATAEILSGAVGGYASPKEATEMARLVIQAHRATETSHEIAQNAKFTFGSTYVANRLVQIASEMLQERSETEKALGAIEWKKCYEDSGSLM